MTADKDDPAEKEFQTKKRDLLTELLEKVQEEVPGEDPDRDPPMKVIKVRCRDVCDTARYPKCSQCGGAGGVFGSSGCDKVVRCVPVTYVKQTLKFVAGLDTLLFQNEGPLPWSE